MAERRGRRELTAAERAKVFKALSDPSRVGIVDVIAKHGAMCGTELAEKLGISLALVCHHWDVLADAGLVTKERVGQAQYCSIDLAKLRLATSDWADEPATRKPRPKARAKAPARAAKNRRG